VPMDLDHAGLLHTTCHLQDNWFIGQW
jgi:hypothetical protein